ncbi:MAG: polymer-forming cytoskeletal protein [Phascolarctobacterium sp.]|nr:polymer-forming cytoskeletal protein [Phascolarctobacterium sp.]
MNFFKKLVANDVEASENVTEVVPQPVQEPQPIPAPVVIPTKTIKKEFKPMDYEVIISQNTAINGNISINGCTRIDGVIDGTLAVDSDLFIGESGNIRATVYAKNATISGQVTGNISCKERLELTSNAKVFGDIKCTTLIIAEGAVFRGKCAGFENYEDAAE